MNRYVLCGAFVWILHSLREDIYIIKAVLILKIVAFCDVTECREGMKSRESKFNKYEK